MSLPTALPPARTPEATTAPSLRWGVLGTGWIASRFIASLQRHSSQQVLAVASRSAETARDFGTRLGVTTTYDSYEALVADPEVDVVYVATPHNLHHEHALLALEAGKHTLVEKPLALNAGEAREIATAAEQAGVFCMEAMWTLFLPKYDVLRQLLADGALGDVRSVVADFGEWFPTSHRIYRPELGGGPLHDLGTYLITFALEVLGVPDRVMAVGEAVPTGVNGQTAMILTTPRQQQAVLHTTILSNTPTAATIAGTEASLVIDGPFYQPGGFTLTASDGSTSLRYEEPRVAHESLHFQAAAVARRITAGETQEPLRPLSASIAVLDVLDEVRHQIAQRFPGEE
jgi:predicted dehydrogenase